MPFKNTIALLLLFLFTPYQSISAEMNSDDLHKKFSEIKIKKFSPPVPVTLADYKGKIIYLDFWASWCASCADSFRFYNELYAAMDKSKFELLAINVDENIRDVEKFLKNFPVLFPLLRDEKGALASVFDIRALPVSFLISDKGKILWRHEGFNKTDIPKIRNRILGSLKELSPSIEKR